MKVSLLAHEGLPFPMSNAPEPPPEPPSGMKHVIAPATQRHLEGKAHLAHIINYWLVQAGLSQKQLSLIADWGLDEPSWLHDTKLTHLRRNNFQRPLPIKYLDALGAANVAIWTWKTQGKNKAMAKYGPPGKDHVEAEWLDNAIWLPDPEFKDEPLGPRDFFDIASGYLDLPYVSSPLLAPNEGPRLTAELVQLLLRLAPDKEGIHAVRHVMSCYEVQDPARRSKLSAVLIGDTIYSREELEAEFYALAQIVVKARGLSPTTYGPSELYTELTSYRTEGASPPSGQ